MEKIKTIGQGGLGIVSLYQEANGQQYAVKRMINPWDNNYVKRFKKEIEIIKTLVHENIVKVLNADTENNNPWYVMPFYKDGSLRDKLKNGKIYSAEEATNIIYRLAEALNHAHQKGAIHRDLKPDNILFDGNKPIIADWGIGKFIHKESTVITNGGLGTPNYCAPEQWNSGESDQRSDIYSLGIIFREIITGSISGHVANLKINAIINKMTMVSPVDRFQSMQEIMQVLKSINTNVLTEQPQNKESPLKQFFIYLAIIGGIILGVIAAIYLIISVISAIFKK